MALSRHACLAAYPSGTPHGNQRGSVPLRKLRPHSVHARTDSHSEFHRRFRECILGGFDKFLMPRRPPAPRAKGLFGDAPAEPKPAAAAYRANIDGGAGGNTG